MLAFNAAGGYTLLFDDLMSSVASREFFGDTVPALANLLLRLPTLLEWHYLESDRVFGDVGEGAVIRTGLRILQSQEAGIVFLSQVLHSGFIEDQHYEALEVFEFIIQKLYALRKPKTNIQILQQSVLLKYKNMVRRYIPRFGVGAYIDTMNKVLSTHFRAYIQALEKLQLDIATSSDLIGVEARSAGLFFIEEESL
ncbi:Poly(ADP-ribose) glycohydrolase 1 [Acorus calamus]|uniref:Poly(ADP-ribose) glycohydrolase 1 n=1 Tax=Acorus calamus TaxID=4465 RepID=A0AAV9F2X5_ACOCL|nr:Poly(ADP-ribose) glycohydrolase 1 [Acorus calamus]